MGTLNNTPLTPLSNVDLVISVGSVDGILTTAALLRIVGKDDVEVCFAQAFTVDRLPVGDWSGRRVALVDLAVNNRDPEMTARFVAGLLEGDNTLVAVIDEHSREDWMSLLGTFDGLAIEPQSQGAGEDAPKSSGEVLRRALAGAEVAVDDHTLELLVAADAGDHMDFTTHFGGIVNQAVKSRIQDDSRRVYLAHHLATSGEADETIFAWIAEYEAILVNHDIVVASREDLGDGIHRVSAVGLTVDMTSLMGRLYGEGAKVVALEGEAFVPAEKSKKVVMSFGTSDRDLDLMAIVREAGITPLGGFAQKVNVDLADEEGATAAIRAALRV